MARAVGRACGSGTYPTGGRVEDGTQGGHEAGEAGSQEPSAGTDREVMDWGVSVPRPAVASLGADKNQLQAPASPPALPACSGSSLKLLEAPSPTSLASSYPHPLSLFQTITSP